MEPATKSFNFVWKTWDCKPVFGKYGNGRVSIQLVDPETYEPIATATVNLPDEQLNSHEVFIKDYSENEGILEALIQEGIIYPPYKEVLGKWVTFYKCVITPEAVEAFMEE